MTMTVESNSERRALREYTDQQRRRTQATDRKEKSRRFHTGDRVTSTFNPYIGTVTADRHKDFHMFVGVKWATGDYAFVHPNKLRKEQA